MRCAKCEKELHACICAWVKTWGGDEWCSLAGTTREWGEGMVERIVAVTKDEFTSIICHESVKGMVELKRAWVGLTDEEIADVFGDYMDSMDETEEDNNWGYERLIEAKLKEKNA